MSAYRRRRLVSWAAQGLTLPVANRAIAALALVATVTHPTALAGFPFTCSPMRRRLPDNSITTISKGTDVTPLITAARIRSLIGLTWTRFSVVPPNESIATSPTSPSKTGPCGPTGKLSLLSKSGGHAYWASSGKNKHG